MTMIHVSAPSTVNGRALADELAAVGIPDSDVVLIGDHLRINADEADRATVERVVAEHVPPPRPPDPDAEFRAAIQAASSIADLKAALLGTKGPGAEPRRPA